MVAAGILTKAPGASLWRVRSLTELGIAVRLAALAGQVDLVPEEEGGERILQLRFTDNPETVARTLFY